MLNESSGTQLGKPKNGKQMTRFLHQQMNDKTNNNNKKQGQWGDL